MTQALEFRPELTDQQVATYWVDGFAVVGRFISDDDLRSLRDAYDSIMAEAPARRLGKEMRGTRPDGSAESLYQIVQPEKDYPELWETSYFRHGQRLAAQILSVPESDLAGHSHMVYKPPFHGRDTPWHQDEAYWGRPDLRDNEPRALTVWLALDVASLESGCMQYIPKSQHAVVPHGFIDDESFGLMVLDPEVERAQAIPLPPGQATMHSCRSVHYTGPNTTGRQRRAWSLEFHAPPVPRTEPDNRYWLPELQRRAEARSELGLI
jgi:phytanoyl-CoA hydroxylase